MLFEYGKKLILRNKTAETICRQLIVNQLFLLLCFGTESGQNAVEIVKINNIKSLIANKIKESQEQKKVQAIIVFRTCIQSLDDF